MNQNPSPSFINPESTHTPDNSPGMQVNELHLQLRNLPKGETVDVDKKRELHRQIVELDQKVFTGADLTYALTVAHQDLEESLTNETTFNLEEMRMKFLSISGEHRKVLDQLLASKQEEEGEGKNRSLEEFCTPQFFARFNPDEAFDEETKKWRSAQKKNQSILCAAFLAATNPEEMKELGDDLAEYILNV